ncbi:MAG: hypothetical protein H9W82_03325 [Lactobacillus sp.]|nr:hypothetical protein [Lactobacillus sp.]
MNKSELMKLQADELANKLNDLLIKFDSKNKLFKYLDLRKQTIDKKLLEAGYYYNNASKCYLKNDSSSAKDMNIKSDNDIIKRIEAIEKRLSALESKPKHSDFKVMKFDSERYSKNYRLNREVVDLIEMVKRDYSHLNVTDVINTVLYTELKKLKK